MTIKTATLNLFKNTHGHRKLFPAIILLGICLLSLLSLVGVQARSNITSTSTTLNTNSYSLNFSTFFGGKWSDISYAIATDSSGNIYVTGNTGSPNLPMKNAYNNTYGGGIYGDAFVAKFSPTGALLFSTFLGGSGSDIGYAIAVDSSGNVYVTGSTTSPNFPMKNAYSNTYNGNDDVFIAKFDPTGALLYSTFLGGSGDDDAYGITIDSAGNYYISGYTSSSNFPMINAYNSTFGGNGDAFVAKFNTSNALVYSTYLGGSNTDFSYGIAVDTNGNCYITGSTGSPNFPIKNAYNSIFGGSYDVFIAKLGPTGTLLFSTFLGGSGSDVAYALTMDSSGNVYATGSTISPNFPMKNAYNNTYGGGTYGDVFVTKVNSTGALLFSTYLGGSGDDLGRGIAVDPSGNIYVTGSTTSSNFPVENGYYVINSGYGDAFVAEFTSSTANSGVSSVATTTAVTTTNQATTSIPLALLFSNQIFDTITILCFLSIISNIMIVIILRRR